MSSLDQSSRDRDSHDIPFPGDDPTTREEIGDCDEDEDDMRRRWPCVLHKLIDEARDDDWFQVVERIRTHPEEVFEKSSPGGLTALHEACVRYPPLHVVEELLKVVPREVVKVKNRDGETPLHTASYSASEEVQETLFRAAPEALVIQDRNYGDSPLHLAARAGATYHLLETFVRSNGRSISIRNRSGATPFWCLRRSYLEAESIEEIIAEEGDDFRVDWDLMVLFLRVSYGDHKTDRETTDIVWKDEEKKESRNGGYVPARNATKFEYLVHAAAATPACPRSTLQFLCRHFAEQALQYDRQGRTPLLWASKADVMPEPKFDEPAGALGEQSTTGDDASVLPNIENLALQNEAGAAGDEDEPESVVNIVLNCNPRAASYADAEGRLPLAHALSTGKRWNGGIKQLIDACPRALECRDMPTHLHMFQLAAINSPELDTVYYMVRSLPELLAFRESHGIGQKVPDKDDSDTKPDGNRKKRRG